MTSDEVMAAIEKLVEQNKYADDPQALQKLMLLLEHVSAETVYAEEKMLQLREAARAFYGEDSSVLDESQRRHDLVIAVSRLKIALSQ